MDYLQFLCIMLSWASTNWILYSIAYELRKNRETKK
jgi:hypothetical protein